MVKSSSELHPAPAFTERGFSAREVLDGLQHYLIPNKDSAEAVQAYGDLRSALEAHVAHLDAGEDVSDELHFGVNQEQLVLNALRFRAYGRMEPFANVKPRTEFAPVVELPGNLSA